MQRIRYKEAKQRALKIMSMIYDPLHDDNHVQEVEQTAIQIYESLVEEKKEKVDLESVKLACMYHDTSRKVIKTNLLLQPFLDGYYSGKIAYNCLLEVGYSKEQALKVKEIINVHETILGLIKKTPDLNGYIFSDADFVEGYSVKRLDRAFKRFERGDFSKLLLNFYVIALVLIHKKKILPFYFKKTKEIYKIYLKELTSYIHKNDHYFKKMLFKPVYKMFMSLDFLMR